MNVWLPFVTAALLTLGVTPVVIAFARKYKLVDDPRVRYHPAHTHKGIIPRAGGLAIFISLLIGIVIFIPLTKLFVGILLGATLLIVVGLMDDYKDVNPY